MTSHTKTKLLCAALVGGLLTYVAGHLFFAPDPNEKIISLEKRIKELEALLTKSERDVKVAQLHSQHPVNDELLIGGKNAEGPATAKPAGPSVTDAGTNSIQLLRNLEINPESNSRTFIERINGLLSGNPSRETIAVAAKGIFDMARDRGHLPDDALQALYKNHSDPDLKRVIAQVLAQRGNDSLLDDLVAKAQMKLKSSQPRDRQDALVQLAKLRNVKAADVILPLLHDPEVDVKLDALLALRNNGNAMSAGYVEMLRTDPNPAVSSLANDVADDLRDLSASARTTISTSDIEAGLPPM